MYSSAISQAHVPTGNGHGHKHHDGRNGHDRDTTALAAALEDMSVTSALEDENASQIHATVRNGYEEDFEDVDGIMNQAEHACRCVITLMYLAGMGLTPQLLWHS